MPTVDIKSVADLKGYTFLFHHIREDIDGAKQKLTHF